MRKITLNILHEKYFFLNLKTIEKPKPQNLYSLSVYNKHTPIHTLRHTHVYINLPALMYYIKKRFRLFS